MHDGSSIQWTAIDDEAAAQWLVLDNDEGTETSSGEWTNPPFEGATAPASVHAAGELIKAAFNAIRL